MADPVCAPDAQWCTYVHDLTGNDTLAKLTDWFVAKPLAILILVIIGIVARWLAHKMIDRLVRRATEGPVVAVLPKSISKSKAAAERKAVGERRRQRAQTMGSLLRSISTAVIAVIVLFMVVAQLGYNIAPLIASAGIIGVALGFGAQSLVRDFISGIFMIMEDQLGVGDYIDIAGTVGAVESVGLRVTRMRDMYGTVWYIRNGEVFTLGNMSQNWGCAVLDVQVGYREDLDVVRDTLLEVARELQQDPDHAEKVLSDPEVWGVQSLDPDRVLMRLAVTTAPAAQWGVGRELRRRIKARFEADGIEIPLPQYVVHGTESPPEQAASVPRP